MSDTFSLYGRKWRPLSVWNFADDDDNSYRFGMRLFDCRYLEMEMVYKRNSLDALLSNINIQRCYTRDFLAFSLLWVQVCECWRSTRCVGKRWNDVYGLTRDLCSWSCKTVRLPDWNHWSCVDGVYIDNKCYIYVIYIYSCVL